MTTDDRAGGSPQEPPAVVAATPLTFGVEHHAVHVVVPRGGTAARLDRPLGRRLS